MMFTTVSEPPRGPMAKSPHEWWSILIVLSFLWTMEFSTAEKPCTAFSSSGDLVNYGSEFQVFCTYLVSCRNKVFHIDKRSNQVEHYNSTTIFLNVRNIQKKTTYTCKCEGEPEPCGLDVHVGYLPNVPENVTCIQKGEFGQVMCTWIRGRETNLKTTSWLWMKALNSTAAPVFYPGFVSSSGLVSANFSVSGTDQTVYSIWVNSSNGLGSAVSPSLNFTLSQIVQPLPPVLSKVECWSRGCEVGVEGIQGSQLLEVRYRANRTQPAGTWTSQPNTTCLEKSQTNVSWSTDSLQPYMLYEFQARVRLGPMKGYWSNWSKSKSKQTEEEAPVKELDVWYTTLNPLRKSITIHWKSLNDTEARGRITGYKVIVHNRLTGTTENITSTNYFSVPFCHPCHVTVYALNSKGTSPSTNVTIPLSVAQAPQYVQCKPHNNHSITISWQKPGTAGASVTGYLVEWFHEHRQVEELRWKRLGPNENHTVITENIKPKECYEGAVNSLYEKAIGRAQFQCSSIRESAPSESPSYNVTVTKEDSVIVSWSELPLGKQGGCVIKYTIYVKISEKTVKQYDCGPSERSFNIRDLPQAKTLYSLSMTASTASGEGPTGHIRHFPFHPQQGPGLDIVMLVVLSLMVVLLLCLTIKCVYKHLMPDTVPDPANSKWGKECTKEKGELTLQFYLSESSISEEDEPDTVEVQELPEDSWMSGKSIQPTDASRPTDGKSHLLQLQLSPVTGPSSSAYFHTSYLQSFSQESNYSDQTQNSQATDISVDYISTHILENEKAEEDEEEVLDVMGFFPCLQNPLNPLLSFRGKLTLDAVRIDCSELLY